MGICIWANTNNLKKYAISINNPLKSSSKKSKLIISKTRGKSKLIISKLELWSVIRGETKPGLARGRRRQCHYSKTLSWGPWESCCSWNLSSSPELSSDSSYHFAAELARAHTLLSNHPSHQSLHRQRDLKEKKGKKKKKISSMWNDMKWKNIELGDREEDRTKSSWNLVIKLRHETWLLDLEWLLVTTDE